MACNLGWSVEITVRIDSDFNYNRKLEERINWDKICSIILFTSAFYVFIFFVSVTYMFFAATCHLVRDVFDKFPEIILDLINSLFWERNNVRLKRAFNLVVHVLAARWHGHAGPLIVCLRMLSVVGLCRWFSSSQNYVRKYIITIH